MKTYAGKILLFGEYSVLYGTKGLVLPYDKFSGAWTFRDTPNSSPDTDLEQFHQFRSQAQSKISFNWDLFKKDIEQGLIFSSSIPTGAGLGSSGALTAAFYDRYALINQKEYYAQGVDLNAIRHDLAALESFHHHKSSGIDPLVSWLQRPIMLKGLSDITVLNQLDGHAEWLQKNSVQLYLIPTHTKRKTGEWIDRFRKKLDQIEFKNWFDDKYCPLVDKTVDNFLDMNNQFFDNIFDLCLQQEQWLNDFMQVKTLQSLRNDIKGINANIKLCGAGGGGYFLLFTQGSDNSELIEKFSLISVF